MAFLDPVRPLIVPSPAGLTVRGRTAARTPVVASLVQVSAYQSQQAVKRARKSEKTGVSRGTAGFTLSYLETSAVKERTYQDYQKRALEFVEWCRVRGVTASSADELDLALVLWCDEKFFRGLSVEDGSKLLSAIKFFFRCTAEPGTLRCRGRLALSRVGETKRR